MNAVTQITEERAGDAARDGETALSLRVLTGRGAGAEHRLPQSRKLLIGHSFENDVVLRHPTTRGATLELTTCGRRAVLKVAGGEVCALGRTFAAGERITLEPYTPVRIGEIAFAIGGGDEARWAEAVEGSRDDPLAVIEEAEEAPRTDLGERLAIRSAPLRDRYLDRLLSPRILAIVGGACLAIAGGAFAGTSLLAPQPLSASEVGSELAGIGYPGLTVETGADGADLSVVGLVESDHDLLRLREWAAGRHPHIAIGAATIVSAAESATNLLAAQGVDAAVRPLGADSLAIESEFLPLDRQSELESLLRADLPRVRRFVFSGSAMRGERDLAYFFNAPGYGAASFVAGDPSFIVTEDGTRWFVGANLPTGHVIVEISDNRVTVEREGLRDTLMM